MGSGGAVVFPKKYRYPEKITTKILQEICTFHRTLQMGINIQCWQDGVCLDSMP